MRLIFTLLALSTFLMAGAQNMEMDVYKLETAPTIDGDAADWDNVWTILGLTREGNSTSDCNAKFQIAYDDANFYLIVAVEDNTPNNSSGSPWYDDCVEVYVSVDTSDAAVDSNFPIQLRYARDGGEITDRGIDLDVVSVSTETGYVMEWAIPWEGLHTVQGEEFTSADDITDLRFALQLADNTDGTNRTEAIYWNAALGGNSGSRANYGYLKLRGYETDNKTIELHSRNSAPTIDGDFTDWGWDNWISIAQSQSKGESQTYDMDSRFQISYNADNFYLIAYTQDKTPFNISGKPWNDDCIELYVSVDTSDAKVVDPYKIQLRFARDMVELTDQGINLEYMVVATDDAWVLELAIPWAGLFESQGEEFTSIEDVTHLRFDIQVADNTDGTNKTQAIYWNNPKGGNAGTRENYGYLVLTENISTVSKFSQELSAVKTNYIYNRDALVVSGYSGELKIYDLSGQLVKRVHINDNNSLVDLSSIKSGMYIVGGKSFVSKFVK